MRRAIAAINADDSWDFAVYAAEFECDEEEAIEIFFRAARVLGVRFRVVEDRPRSALLH
ncbi:hypothetical protein [Pararobbsia silviterrae]|uniref:hypothetical protein n=1 Tax=Pararobbsia silviterrae TaxID=1792498 RepID=UPI001314C922|nr:hypothetical protein [Pararobbsia silviterrae]